MAWFFLVVMSLAQAQSTLILPDTPVEVPNIVVKPTAPKPTPPPPTPVTRVSWNQVFNEVLRPQCLGCHRGRQFSGGIRFDNYNLTRGNLHKMWEQVSSKRMPPDYLGESPLSDAQIALLRNWIRQGAPGPDGKSVPLSPALVGDADAAR